MKDKFSLAKIAAMYEEAESERSEFVAEWRQISEYLLPGRGIYQQYSKPRKRKLTSARVVNPAAEDALYVLTSGIHGGLTSPSRMWFKNEWQEEELNTIEPLKAWIQDTTRRMHNAYQASNFYAIVNSFYIELVGFGTACMYIGEDTPSDSAPYRFELLTAGEYAFTTGTDGRLSTFFRTIFMTPRQVIDRFPKTASANLKRQVKNNEAGADTSYITLIEYVCYEPFQGKPITRLYYEATSSSKAGANYHPVSQQPLEVSGFYEFPYEVARWSTIGSDDYGVGPGSRALPDIKRLQEMEKAFLMAAHKALDPPVNAPSRMKGKLNTLPGGYNYYANPNEQVTEIFSGKFDYQGVGGAIERVEQRIQRNFFNDIFLTASRDPNASPLKARQVDAQDQEKMLRLGPVIERLQHEFLLPMNRRCFNIMKRKELFALLPPELDDLAGDYTVTLISPLATAQRAIAMQGIQTFMAFIGQAAQFDQSILDNINADAAAREVADISGVDLGVLRPAEEVQNIRTQRAKAQQAQQAKEEQMAVQQHEAQMNVDTATAQKTQSEAGVNLLEGQQMAQDMGMI